jgi:hypothetical protein
MANIKVLDLNSITGADLFSDSESFIHDLSESDNELNLQGGSHTLVLLAITFILQA